MTVRDEYFSFSSPGTFCGVPAASLDDLGDAAVVIVGAPLDWSASGRPGARFGPKAIREGDYLGQDGRRPHIDSGIDALQELGVVDVGDVKMPPGYVEEGLDRITDVVETVTRTGAIPIVLGGDHSVTFANATAVARYAATGPSPWSTSTPTPTPTTSTTACCTATGRRCGALSNRGPYPAIDSYKSVYAGIGHRPTSSNG